jgi:NAD(P)-dependent dehydrogenase (short-subunit alcohol dehydrogenase family)
MPPSPMAHPTVRTALVTGANRGLGLETSKRLLEMGLHVIVTSRGHDEAALPAELRRHASLATRRPLDVADARSVSDLAQGLGNDGVMLDLLVNNAGIALDGFNLDVARQTLEVNFFGAERVTDALLPRLRDGATIVMVSSGMGELAAFAPPLRQRFLDPSLTRIGLAALMQAFLRDVKERRHREAGWPSSAYRVSKAGLNALTRVLARDLAGRKIRVNAVCPGWVRTDMGGAGASRSVERGAASILWATAENGPTGGFFRDGKPIEW